MTRRQSFLAHLALLAGVSCFASSFARPSSGQAGAAPSAIGRYQHSVDNQGSNLFVTDTTTGHTWRRSTAPVANWVDLGAPPVSR